MKHKFLAVLTAIITTLVITGCTQKPQVTQSPYTPAVTLSPEYKQAQEVVRSVIELDIKALYSANPPRIFPEEDYANYIRDGFLETTKDWFNEHENISFSNSDTITNKLRPYTNAVLEDSVAQIQVCQDLTNIVALRPDGTTVQGGINQSIYYLNIKDEELKVFAVRGEAVKKCDF